MNMIELGQAYITIKDHKPNFPAMASFRLINPAKSQLGKVSKQILEKINKQLKKDLNLNQWRSTAEALKWFKNVENKEKHNLGSLI